MEDIRRSLSLLEKIYDTPTEIVSENRPMFLQILDDVREQIAKGELTEHAALPSERSLAEKYGISRMTARRALEALEYEGLAYSEDRRGRFVSPRRLRYNVSEMVSFVADAQSKGSNLEIVVIKMGTTTADERLARLLEQEIGTQVHEYTRLFLLDGHAIFIETECVIADRFPDFLDNDLRQSTTRLLEEDYSTCSSTGDIIIRMHSTSNEEAALLNIKASHAAIELEQVIRDQNGTPFCFGRQVWRGELAEFSARAIVTRGGDNEC
jgi:GntR family transcriptional regulator